jgi:hypothetical protein
MEPRLLDEEVILIDIFSLDPKGLLVLVSLYRKRMSLKIKPKNKCRWDLLSLGEVDVASGSRRRPHPYDSQLPGLGGWRRI